MPSGVRNLLWFTAGGCTTRILDIALTWTAGLPQQPSATTTLVLSMTYLGIAAAGLAYDAGRRRAALAAAGERENV